MEKKYELTNETKELYGRILHRIRALKDFGNVKAGDLGGFVEREENLSQEGLCWVYGEAIVYGKAQVLGEARVYGKAEVFGKAIVYGKASIYSGSITSTNDYICIGPIGSRNDFTTFFKDGDKIMVKCGCFKGDIEEFKKAVEREHRGHLLCLNQYKGAIIATQLSLKPYLVPDTKVFAFTNS